MAVDYLSIICKRSHRRGSRPGNVSRHDSEFMYHQIPVADFEPTNYGFTALLVTFNRTGFGFLIPPFDGLKLLNNKHSF